MGCDIHIVVERRGPPSGPGKWVGIYASDVAYPIIRRNMIAAQRNYAFFAELASVRGSSSKPYYPRNLPEDMSDLTRQQFWQAPTDYHSASYMTPDEFATCWLTANENSRAEIRKDHAVSDLLGIDSFDDGGFEFRVVFWFDN